VFFVVVTRKGASLYCINPMSLNVHPDIASLTPYVPGKPVEELERELGIPKAIKLAPTRTRLARRPKPWPHSPRRRPPCIGIPTGARTSCAWPWRTGGRFSRTKVILGNGSDEIIGLLARTFLSPGDEAVMAEQTFVIYKMEVTAAHGTPVIVPMQEGRHDLAAMAQAITPRTRLLFLCNPNNPTGTMVTADEVNRLMACVPEPVIVVFDEAYYEYVQSREFPDSLTYVKQGRNAICSAPFLKFTAWPVCASAMG